MQVDGWLSDEWELFLSSLEYHHTLLNCFCELLWKLWKFCESACLKEGFCSGLTWLVLESCPDAGENCWRETNLSLLV